MEGSGEVTAILDVIHGGEGFRIWFIGIKADIDMDGFHEHHFLHDHYGILCGNSKEVSAQRKNLFEQNSGRDAR